MAKRVCRVLIVEDQAEVRDLLGDAFSSEGFRFSLASSAIEMREVLAAWDVDLAVIDIVLPGGMSGLVLAKEVDARGIAVILVTGSHDHSQNIEESGHPFLLGPFKIGALLSMTTDLLRESKARCRTKDRIYGA
jgi:two-component system, OmpR family, response regulator